MTNPGHPTRAEPESGGPVPLAILMIVYAVMLSVLCVNKYRAFLYDDIDLGIFTEALANLMHGSLASSIRGASWLGDHSSLSLFLVAPFYSLVRSPVTLLVAQSVALALGAIPVHRLARRETGNERVAIGFAAVYLLYPALGYLNLFEFHPEAFSTPALLACFAMLREGRARATAFWAVVALLGKEDVALVVAAFGVYAFALRRRESARLGATLLALAAGSLVLSFGVLKPWLAAGAPAYGAMYEGWGRTPGAVAGAIAREPWRAVAALFATPGNPHDSLLKQQYWLQMLLPLAFLPLAAPEVLALALPVIGEHMLSWRPQQHAIVYQYTALVIPVFLAAAIVGLARISRSGRSRAPAPLRLAGFALLASLLAQALYGPVFGAGILQAARPIQKASPDARDLALAAAKRAMLAKIPAGTGVVAGFEFLAPLAGRDTLYSLHHVLSGHYTFSSRPFPTPRGVGAMVADFANPRLAIYPDLGTSRRLGDLVVTNQLALVENSGSLRLYRRGTESLPPTVAPGTCDTSGAAPEFDHELAFLGATLADSSVAASRALSFATCWRVFAPVDRLFLTEWLLLDDAGHDVASHMRYLGEMIDPPSSWPPGTAMVERYEWPLPHGLAPGRYRLAMRVGRRFAGRSELELSEVSDPSIAAAGGVVPLGQFTVPMR